MPLIKSSGFNIGEDFFLVYSPEREDPGNLKFETSNILREPQDELMCK